jgi:hypothetical protein
MSINSDAALFSYCTMHKFIFVREVYRRKAKDIIALSIVVG